jgi:hypothetical protein
MNYAAQIDAKNHRRREVEKLRIALRKPSAWCPSDGECLCDMFCEIEAHNYWHALHAEANKKGKKR